MANTLRKLEACSYVAVIAASLTLCIVLISHQRTLRDSGLGTTKRLIIEGQTIAIPGVDWSHSNRSVVLALSSHCPYCIKSTEFYSTLADTKQRRHLPIQIIAAFPEATDTAEDFLSSHKVVVDKVIRTSLADMHVEATPTVLIVDDHGRIAKEWVGKLTQEGEQQVIADLLN